MADLEPRDLDDEAEEEECVAVEASVLVDDEAEEKAECEEGVRRRIGAEACWVVGVLDRLVTLLVGVA